MKNIKTFEGFLDKFRPNTSDPLPEPEEIDIKGKSIKGKDLEDLQYRIIRDFDGEMDLYIDVKYLEFIDINTERVICSFSGIPQPGETIDEEGNILDDEESEECDCPMLYYDIHGSYLEVFKNRTDKIGEVEFTFDLRNAQDITDIMDIDNSQIVDENFEGGGREEYLAKQDADLETDFQTKYKNYNNDKVEKALNNFIRKKDHLGEDWLEEISDQIKGVINDDDYADVKKYYPGFTINDFKSLLVRMKEEGLIK